MVYWVCGGWAFCAIATIIIERAMAMARGHALWDKSDPWISGFAYSVFILFSPLVVIFSMLVGGLHWANVALRALIGKPVWLDDSRDSILVRLVERRRKHDNRLKSEKIFDWPMWRYWETPEALIYDLVIMYHTLKSDEVAEPLIWEKLEAYREEFGEGEMPASPSLTDYITYRLNVEEPDYLNLGHDLINQQVRDCKTHVLHGFRQAVGQKEFPPRDWLIRQLSLLQFERLGEGADPIGDGAPAMMSRGNDNLRKEWMGIKVRMLAGDQIWVFNSPKQNWEGLAGRAGVALVRNGRSIAYMVTKKN